MRTRKRRRECGGDCALARRRRATNPNHLPTRTKARRGTAQRSGVSRCATETTRRAWFRGYRAQTQRAVRHLRRHKQQPQPRVQRVVAQADRSLHDTRSTTRSTACGMRLRQALSVAIVNAAMTDHCMLHVACCMLSVARCPWSIAFHRTSHVHAARCGPSHVAWRVLPVAGCMLQFMLQAAC